MRITSVSSIYGGGIEIRKFNFFSGIFLLLQWIKAFWANIIMNITQTLNQGSTLHVTTLLKSYMPTFPIYVGFSWFEAVEKLNPNIPIGIARLPQNPDFIKISPFSRRVTPNFKSRATLFHVSQSEIGTSSPPLLVYMSRVSWTGVMILSY
jgi:hypothetical protein